VGKPQTFRSPTALVVWVVWLLFAVGNWIDLAVQGRDHASAIAAALLLLATGFAYDTAQRPRIVADDAGMTIRNPLRDHRVGWASVAKVDLVDLLRVHCDGGPGVAPGDQDKKQRKIISAWAVHYSRRHKLAAQARIRRAASLRRSGLGFSSGARGPYGARGLSSGRGASYGAPAPETSTAEAEAEKVVRTLSERATAARAEAVWAAGTADSAGSAGSAGSAEPAGSQPAASQPAGAKTAQQATGAAAEAGWTEPLTSTWNSGAIAALVIPALIVLTVWLL
jgi:Bacterial PH domain